MPTPIEETVLAFTWTIDRRDWEAYRALFRDEVDIHYPDDQPGLPRGTIPAEDWAKGAQHTFDRFPATHHHLVVVKVEERGDEATVWSNCVARHYDPDGLGDARFDQFMHYRHELKRDADGWFIAAIRAYIPFDEGNALFFVPEEKG